MPTAPCTSEASDRSPRAAWPTRWLRGAFGCALLLLASVAPARGQTLTLTDEVKRTTALPQTVITMDGRAELHLSDASAPLTGSTVHLNSEDAWVFLTAIKPSSAKALLSQFRVNGAAATDGTNVKVVQYVNGSVILPHPASFQPLTVYPGQYFSGTPRKLSIHTAYGNTELAELNDNIRSFVLKRGYTATFAQNPDGTGSSRNFVAQDADLELTVLPNALDRTISFIRVFPWRYSAKKGSCDQGPLSLNARWHYNWNISQSAPPVDYEYVAIKQQPWWPSLDTSYMNWLGVSHLSGYNEPDNPVEDAYQSLSPKGSTANAVERLPELLKTGLRVGAPAVTDGGYSWIVDYMNRAAAAGHRIDYVPVHYYRSYWNKTDPQGAASQMYDFLKSIYDATGKPVWVTEFNNGANWTDNNHDPSPEQNRDAIRAMIQMMDATPWIERYAIYSRVEWFRQTHYDEGGLTPMGTMYRDHLSPMAYRQTVPDPGKSAAAEYLFEDTVHDSSGSGNNPLTYGTPKAVVGRQGKALAFDGTDDWLALPPRLGDSTDFTFTAWVKWGGGKDWQRIFDLGNGESDYMYLCPSTGGRLRFTIRKDWGAEQQLNATALTPNVWTHVAVTLSGNTGKLFVNGSLAATHASMTVNPTELGTISNYIGKSQFADPLFNGQLDSVRFLTYALTDAQVAAAASTANLQFISDPLSLPAATPRQPYTAALTAYATTGNGGRKFTKLSGPAWLAVAADGNLTGVPPADATGTNSLLIRMTDASGLADTTTAVIRVAEPPGMVTRYPFNGNTQAAVGPQHGTASGSPAFTAGRISNAIALDGNDDFVTLPGQVANHENLTIAAWVFWNGGSPWQRIFDFGSGTANNLFLTPRSSSNTLRFGITRNGSSQMLNAPQLPSGTWNHLAVTLANGIGTLYVNGIAADSRAITHQPTDILQTQNFLGKSQWPDPLFNGRIDEFVIFNHALDAPSIAALFAGSPPAFPADPFSRPNASIGTPYAEAIGTLGLTYAKASGPRWLTVEPDGRISGVPTQADAGTNRFTVRATAPNGYADDASLVIQIPAPPNLRALYPFHGSPFSATGNFNGTPTGAPAYATAIFDQAVDFDGSDDFITLPAATLAGLNDVTLAVRFRWDGGSNWQRIFDFGAGTGAYLFLSPNAGSQLRFAITTGSSEQRLNAPSPPLNEWTHVAITLIGNTGTLYVNGAAVDTQTITLKPSQINTTANYLGKSQFTTDPLFRGAIDDFRIYTQGLTASEVATLAIPPAATPVPRPPYESWSKTIPFPSGQETADLDPDNDQYANLFEFLTGSDPLNPDSTPRIDSAKVHASDLGFSSNKNYLILSARVLKNRTGITLTAEAATTLEGLDHPNAATQATQVFPPFPDGDFEVLTWYLNTPIEDQPAGFLRLRATTQ